jgi:D-aminopeptidase
LYVKIWYVFIAIILTIPTIHTIHAQDGRRCRDYGIHIGILPVGKHNAITDVKGVMVGHTTKQEGDRIRTGVTAILPHGMNVFQNKVPASVFVGNGFGKLSGSTQVDELGNLETPIVLTNTLSVPVAAEALIRYTLAQSGNEEVGSVNPIVGETNDGRLNDIRGMEITVEDVHSAIKLAKSGPVEEGNVGAGTGTICFGYKGGIGTASRKLPPDLGGYTVGVLVQSNFGGVLKINGIQVGQILGHYPYKKALGSADGSCMIIIATDAPLDSRNLKRLAKRSMLGLGNTGGYMSNGSGDYAIAFSTYPKNIIPYSSKKSVRKGQYLRNEALSPLFLSVVEATEEAVINSLFQAETMVGKGGTKVEALPVKKVLDILTRKIH